MTSLRCAGSSYGYWAIQRSAGVSRATYQFVLTSKGMNARIPPHVEELIAGSPESGTVDAHGIQPYYAGLVARAAGMKVSFSLDGDAVKISATPAAMAAEQS